LNREPVLDLILSSPSLFVSVSTNDLMDQTYIKAATRVWDKAFSEFLQRSI
jgi:hypothetical protein